MKIKFNINYCTKWGESLYVVGNCKELGDSDVAKAVKMDPKPYGMWTLDVEVPNDSSNLCYSYLVKNDNGAIRYEWGKPHEFVGGKGVSVYELYDHWNDQPENNSCSYNSCYR